MGKKKYTDPAVDQLAVVDARSLLLSNIISMGWQLAVMVLLPLFIGVQIDRRFDTAPNFTLGAFFIAVFGSGYLIWRTYNTMRREQLVADIKRAKRKTKRSMNA